MEKSAEIANFDIGRDIPCDKNKPSVIVAGKLTARMGTISGGYLVLGRSSELQQTVKLPCTTRVENHDSIRNGDIDFAELRPFLLHESMNYCLKTDGDRVNVTGDSIIFTPNEHSYSCQSFYQVYPDQVRLARRFVNNGTDYYRNVVIAISGMRVELRDFRMEGFNPRRTLLVYCGNYGDFGWYNARISASVFAVTSSFTAMDSIVNGSIIAGGLRGSLATMNVPYVTC